MSLNILNPSRVIGSIGLGSAIAIATLIISPAAMARNQSDVTGPNISDITGPNLSDTTGPNQSDNTGTNLSDTTGPNSSDNPDLDPPTIVLPERIENPQVSNPNPTSPGTPSANPNNPSAEPNNSSADPNNSSASLGAPILVDTDGNAATLGQVLDSFFRRFGDDLDIEMTEELRDKIVQAQAACTPQSNQGTRRFALTSRTSQLNQACEEFNRFVQSIRQALDQRRQGPSPATAVQNRLW